VPERLRADPNRSAIDDRQYPLSPEVYVGSAAARYRGTVNGPIRTARVAGIHHKEQTMATYIALINYTDQGIRTVKDSPNRLAAAAKLGETLGVTVKQAYWTCGQYDMVVTFEGPDEALAAFMYKLGSLGNIRSTSLRAFNAEEMQRILARVP
jgi:uncharacterized protein with GYD domain